MGSIIWGLLLLLRSFQGPGDARLAMNSGLKQCALARNKTQKFAEEEPCQDGTSMYKSCLGHAHLSKSSKLEPSRDSRCWH